LKGEQAREDEKKKRLKEEIVSQELTKVGLEDARRGGTWVTFRGGERPQEVEEL